LWRRHKHLKCLSAFFGGQGAQYEPSKNEALSFRNMYVKAGN
jgi:hypothetical protein